MTATARPFALFGALAALIGAMSIWLVGSVHFAAHPDALATAISIDLTVTVALIWLATVVRSGAAKVISTGPVFLLGFASAYVLLPAAHRGALGVFEVVAAGLEVALLVTAALRIRAIRRGMRARRADGQPWLEAVEGSLADSLGSPLLARMVTAEAAAIHYGVLGWFRKAPRDGFSVWREAGWPAILGVFTFLITVETVGIHLLVERWSVVVAWLLTAASAYSAVWLFGDWNALRLEPVRVHDDAISVAVGLRWRVRIPRARITRIEARSDLEELEGHLNAAVIGDPTVVITVDEPLVARGPFGIERTFTRIGLSIDDVPGFLAATEARRR